MSEDKAIHTLYEMLKTGGFMCVVPYGDKGRYATYYAEDKLYLVFDIWYHGLFLVEAKSPRDAIDQVNRDRLAYVSKKEGADDEKRLTLMDAFQICMKEHPIIADWLNEIRKQKDEPQTDYERGYQDGIRDEIDKHHVGR